MRKVSVQGSAVASLSGGHNAHAGIQDKIEIPDELI